MRLGERYNFIITPLLGESGYSIIVTEICGSYGEVALCHII